MTPSDIDSLCVCTLTQVVPNWLLHLLEAGGNLLFFTNTILCREIYFSSHERVLQQLELEMI